MHRKQGRGTGQKKYPRRTERVTTTLDYKQSSSETGRTRERVRSGLRVGQPAQFLLVPASVIRETRHAAYK